jgi:hypothetical protein
VLNDDDQTVTMDVTMDPDCYRKTLMPAGIDQPLLTFATKGRYPQVMPAIAHLYVKWSLLYSTDPEIRASGRINLKLLPGH